MAEARLKAVLTADSTKFTKSFKKAGEETKKLNKGFSKLVGTVQGLGAMRLASALGGLFVVRKLINLSKESVRLAGIQEKAEARLETVMRNVAGATDEQTQSLKDNAAALQQLTTFGDEEIISAQALLGTFALSTEQISTLTPRILDMSAALEKTSGGQVDLQASTLAVGKAMTMGIGSLSRYGVVISDTQRKAFQLADAEEKVLILAEALDANFQGIAEGSAKTFAGQLEQLKNDAGDVKEGIGTLIQEGLKPLVSELKIVVSGVKNSEDGLERWRGKVFDSANSLIFMGKVLITNGKILARVFTQFIPDIMARGAQIWATIFTKDFWLHPIKTIKGEISKTGDIFSEFIDKGVGDLDKLADSWGGFINNAVTGFSATKEAAGGLPPVLDEVAESGKKAMEELEKSAEKAVEQLQKIQDKERENSVEFMKSQMEKKQSFKERLSEMTVEAEARRMEISKEIAALQTKKRLTGEERIILAKLFEDAKKAYLEVEKGVGALGVGAVGGLSAETIGIAERGDIDKLISAFRTQQAEDTVTQATKQESLTGERGTLGATFNFDFSGADITDEDKLVQKIIAAVNRADALTEQGVK